MVFAGAAFLVWPICRRCYMSNLLRRLCTLLLSGLACYLLAVQAVAGDLGPPHVPGPPRPVAAPTFRRVLVKDIQLGSLRIVMEKTRLTELARRFPETEIHHRGDAGDSLTWVCYTVRGSSGSFHIWLDSGELEGGDAIDGVVVSPATGAPRPECPGVNIGKGPVALDGGVWLGATISAVRGRLGRPSRVYQSMLYYDFRLPLHDDSRDCSIGGGLSLEIEGGIVSRLWADKTTSC